MSSEETAVVQSEEQTVAQLLMNPNFQRQVKLALPRAGVTAERLVRTALTEVRRNPKLQLCSRNSLLAAIMDCATYGLEPGPMGFAWIIPYGTEAQFQLGYKGLLALLWRSEQIASISSEVVYERDDFDWNEGSDAYVKFRRKLDGDRGNRIAVFAAISTKAGGNIVRVMSVSDVETHRDRFSKAKGSSPWKTDFDEMACKTLLKRVAKRAPISAEAQAAIARDDQDEFGSPAEIDVTPAAAEKPKPSEAVKGAVRQKAAEVKGGPEGGESPEKPETRSPFTGDEAFISKAKQGQLIELAKRRARELGLGDADEWSTVLAAALGIAVDKVTADRFDGAKAAIAAYTIEGGSEGE